MWTSLSWSIGLYCFNIQRISALLQETQIHFQTVMNLEKEMELSLYADDTLIYIPIAELLFF